MPVDHLDLILLETPIGRLWVAATEVGLLAVERAEDPLRLIGLLDGLDAELSERRTVEAHDQLRAYFAGERRSFDLPLDLRRVAGFDALVYRAVLAVPYGATASYADVAMAVGAPRAARAVGNALARCRFSPVVPCHRIIRADGSVGGWGGDTWVKEWLLDLERG